MHLTSASFDSQLIKGEIFQYNKGIILSVKNNLALLEQSLHSALSGDKDSKHYTLQPGDLIY